MVDSLNVICYLIGSQCNWRRTSLPPAENGSTTRARRFWTRLCLLHYSDVPRMKLLLYSTCSTAPTMAEAIGCAGSTVSTGLMCRNACVHCVHARTTSVTCWLSVDSADWALTLNIVSYLTALLPQAHICTAVLAVGMIAVISFANIHCWRLSIHMLNKWLLSCAVCSLQFSSCYCMWRYCQLFSTQQTFSHSSSSSSSSFFEVMCKHSVNFPCWCGCM